MSAPTSTSTAIDLRTNATPKSKRHRYPLWLEIAVLVCAAVLGAAGMKFFVAEVYSVPSGSMAPTINSGQRVAIEKLTYNFREPQRGEVVVFDGNGLFADPAPGVHTFVKRVIGASGDHVVCCTPEQRLTVNGVELDESAYLAPGQAPSSKPFDVTVPAHTVWVMGDHRDSSADSRAYQGERFGGFIPVDRVSGRAFAVVWPWADAHSLAIPDTFSAVRNAGQ